ncbi:MAG: SDR family NAD(P)-dependent oxidoreductase [Clostridia bacterium]
MERVALVTAGLSGLGKAITERLLEEGYRVAATTRKPSGIAAGASLSQRDRLLVARWHTDRPATDARLVAETLDRFGRLDALILNAGPYHRVPLKLADTPDAIFQSMLDGNLGASFRLMRAALPALRTCPHARIVTVGYVGAGAALGWPERGPYAAAKAGLAALTRTVAAEEREHGITANMVCPSDIRAGDKGRREGRGRGPVGGDVARLISFLLAETSDHLTGQVLDLAFAPASMAAKAGIAVPVPSRQRPRGSAVHPRGWSAPGRIEDARLCGDEWEYQVRIAELLAWIRESDLEAPGESQP